MTVINPIITIVPPPTARLRRAVAGETEGIPPALFGEVLAAPVADRQFDRLLRRRFVFFGAERESLRDKQCRSPTTRRAPDGRGLSTSRGLSPVKIHRPLHHPKPGRTNFGIVRLDAPLKTTKNLLGTSMLLSACPRPDKRRVEDVLVVVEVSRPVRWFSCERGVVAETMVHHRRIVETEFGHIFQ